MLKESKLWSVVGALWMLVLTACASAPQPLENYEPPQVVQPEYQAPTGGAIYAANSRDRKSVV